jgi:hypothetical protein
MPHVIAALVMATGLAWTIHLIVAPEPWAVDSAFAIALGTLVFSIVAMSGLLLSRGRWTRYFANGLIAAELLILLVADFEPWLLVAVVGSVLSLVGLNGPWLKGWLRERPAAGSPGVIPLGLAIGAFALVPLVGLASPSGLEYAHGILAAVGILSSWGYIKGYMWALWLLRIALPLLATVAATASPPGGFIIMVVVALGFAWSAWTEDARLAVDPLPATLPAPRRRPS